MNIKVAAFTVSEKSINTNVDQVIGDSLVENNFVTKFCWMLHLSRKYSSSLNRETKLLNR